MRSFRELPAKREPIKALWFAQSQGMASLYPQQHRYAHMPFANHLVYLALSPVMVASPSNLLGSSFWGSMVHAELQGVGLDIVCWALVRVHIGPNPCVGWKSWATSIGVRPQRISIQPARNTEGGFPNHLLLRNHLPAGRKTTGTGKPVILTWWLNQKDVLLASS